MFDALKEKLLGAPSLENAVDGRVTILIPSLFDSRLILELCIRSIQKNTDYPDYNIIVCDAGVDEEARTFLESEVEKGSIRLIKATDWERPKDDLAAAADGKYYVILHDDVYIKDKSWLRRRMHLMLSHPQNAVVGSTVPNYKTNGERFFPMGLLVKTVVARELNLKWGKQVQEGFDTGAIAWRQFNTQSTYKFAFYKTSRDIHHFGEMTWPKYKKADSPGIQDLLDRRDQKLNQIREMLATGRY
jgi:hypothetical protein